MILPPGIGQSRLPTLQGIGQSNAPTRLSEINVSGPGSSLGSSSQQSAMRDPPRSFDHISGAIDSTAGILIYPADRPKYFMQFGIYEYNRRSFTDVGSLNPWNGGTNSIVMPLSENLQDNLQANWEQRPIPWMIGGIAEAIKGLPEGPTDEEKAAAAKTSQDAANGNAIAGTALGAGLTRGFATVDKIAGTNLGSAVGALTGFAPNQFMTILYIGPEYKQYTFQWNVSARDARESETLRRIINVFKKAMSPTIKYVVLWGYPCVFRIMFKPNNEQLYKFKPCVLKDFRVNFTPTGRAAFYRGVGAPEGMTISATFLELEYWTQESMREMPLRDTELTTNNDGKNNPT